MSSISVIIPARNASNTIVKAASSVLQNQNVVEVLIVDDGSSDSTAAEALSIGDQRVKILVGPNRGVAAALNTGFAAASAQYIARCDADDVYQIDRLFWQLEWLNAHSEFVAISSGFRTVAENSAFIAELATNYSAQEVTTDLLEGKSITSFCTWLTRSETIAKTGGAREWFVTAEDIDLMARIASFGRVWHDPRVGYDYTLSPQSITHTQADTMRMFYEKCARDFALQRRDNGTDQLENGFPPELPRIISEAPANLSDQISGHYVAMAWRHHGSGNKRAAISSMFRAILLKPFQLGMWKSLLALLIKS